MHVTVALTAAITTTAPATSFAATSTASTVSAAPTVSAISADQSQVDMIAATGRFRPPGTATNAFTYDTRLVPADSSVAVGAVYVQTAADKVRGLVKLQVHGLSPERVYGAHVHYLPCGATGAAAGAHYQHVRDPAVGESRTHASTDPAYARPGNEIWLDFTTDKLGAATAETTMDWRFRPGEARSMVIHERHTSHGGSGHPPAGDAGSRLGCLTVPF